MKDKKAQIKFIEDCYRLYEQKMYLAAYCILHDSGRAEDAVQEAFLKLMKSEVYFAEAESEDCKKYIITVIRHAAIDQYNRKKKEQEIVCFSDETVYLERIAASEEKEEETDIKELISDLPVKYRVVVDCLAVKNLSVRETAGKLGISEAAVRKRFERSKKILKSVWRENKVYETGNGLHEAGNV